MCQDPDAPLSKDTLLELLDFTQKFDPSLRSSMQLEEAITYLLEHLRSANIPSLDMSCCAHTLGQYHSEMALACLTKIIISGQLDANPHLTTRLAEAMPDIRAWIAYTYLDWIVNGRFIGRENKDRVEGFRSVVPFIDAACRMPHLREALVGNAHDRKGIHLLLSFCWQMESEPWFEEADAAGHFPFISASSPIWTLLRSTIHEKLITGEVIDTSNQLGFSPFRHLDDDAKAALRRLDDSASLPLPALAGHIGVLSALAHDWPSGLLWQHSIGKVTRVLGEITSVPYRAETAEEVGRCIEPCLFYLCQCLKQSDGRSFVAEVLHSGILPALVRAAQWIPPEHEAFLFLLRTMAIISSYTIYPSIFGPYITSLARDNIPTRGDQPLDSILTGTEIILAKTLRLESAVVNLECENASPTTCSTLNEF
ncbi:hypothetical protein B0H16DRAFT_1855847 [Mycena metata]|uniref:Uncharacterized protein n=1 Tax=Mycena metata TaxID=1033252 RepID=A0AAD7N4M9_9AGAR|nr:hypothetical protein B0H16DRAFT_1855847 [Mycena metata]